MSRENVEIIRRVYDRWGRDREIDPDEFHPDFEISTPMTRLDGRTRRGHEGYKAWRSATDEVLTDDWFEVDELVDIPEGMLANGWMHIKGKASGLETREPAVQLWTFTDGQPSSMTAARTLEETLAAVGLRE